MEASGGTPCTCTALTSLVGSAIGKFSYGASIARGACGVWKVSSALLASFKDTDESRWVLQKWEEEVEGGKILRPTQSHAETTPSSLCALSPPSPHPDGDSSLPAITSANASSTSLPLAMEE